VLLTLPRLPLLALVSLQRTSQPVLLLLLLLLAPSLKQEAAGVQRFPAVQRSAPAAAVH
jgi:hypothetical protein